MKRRARNRAGYTTLELIVNLASASVLLMGLASTIYLSTFAFSDVHDSRTRARAAEVQADMMADLQCATALVDASSDHITFRVPDRDNDGDVETLSYFHSSSPARLMYSINGGTAGVLLDDVLDCRFNYLDRTIQAPEYTPPPLDPSRWGTRWSQP